jgi:hypothetical protein
LGPMNFFRDASHSLITIFSTIGECWFSLTPKIAVALQFPFSAYRTTSRLNFAIYDGLFLNSGVPVP